MNGDILKAKVNSFVSFVFVASFTLWMFILVWQALYNHNPLGDALVNYNLVTPAYLDK